MPEREATIDARNLASMPWWRRIGWAYRTLYRAMTRTERILSGILLGYIFVLLICILVANILNIHLSEPWATIGAYAWAASELLWYSTFLYLVTHGAFRRLPARWRYSWRVILALAIVYARMLGGAYNNESHILPGHLLPTPDTLPSAVHIIGNAVDVCMTFAFIALVVNVCVQPNHGETAAHRTIPEHASHDVSLGSRASLSVRRRRARSKHGAE